MFFFFQNGFRVYEWKMCFLVSFRAVLPCMQRQAFCRLCSCCRFVKAIQPLRSDFSVTRSTGSGCGLQVSSVVHVACLVAIRFWCSIEDEREAVERVVGQPQVAMLFLMLCPPINHVQIWSRQTSPPHKRYSVSSRKLVLYLLITHKMADFVKQLKVDVAYFWDTSRLRRRTGVLGIIVCLSLYQNYLAVT